MQHVRALTPTWVEGGGDPSNIAPLWPMIDEHLKAGRFTEAESLVDQVLATVGAPAPASPGPSTGAAQHEQLIPGVFADRPRPLDVRPIPRHAAIVFWSTRSQSLRPDTPSLGPSHLYTMDANGTHITQITYGAPHSYEHAAISSSRALIAANRYLTNGAGETALWLLDLENKTETRLVPNFFSAGNGGVDWSPTGFIYFSGKPLPESPRDIFRIRADGTNLTRLTFSGTANPGEHFDVSVSKDGQVQH